MLTPCIPATSAYSSPLTPVQFIVLFQVSYEKFYSVSGGAQGKEQMIRDLLSPHVDLTLGGGDPVSTEPLDT